MSTNPRVSVPVIPVFASTLRRRTWPRRILRGTAAGLASVLALVALAIGFIHTPWGKSFVRGRVETLLAGKINGRVQLGSLDYSFMFGEIRLGKLEIRDAAGHPAIALGSLTVDLDRGSLVAGSPVIDNLAIDDLAVSVAQAADGTTNLTGLFKPSNGKPLDHLRVAQISVTGAATIHKPDGTSIAVDGLTLAGSLDAHPATQEVELALGKLGARIAIHAPDAPVHHVALALESVTLARHADAIDVAVKELTAGAIGIHSLAAHASLAGGALHGDQSVTLAGLRVDGKQLAELVGREILIDDVAVDAKISGPENHLAISGAVRSHGASLTLDGEVDLGSPARPRYRLSLVGSGLRSDLVKTAGKPMPLVETGIRVDLAGAGISPGDLDATLALEIGATKVGTLVLDGLAMKATAKRGAYELEHLEAHALGVEVAGAGTLAADSTLHGRVTVSGELPRVNRALAAAGFALPKHVQLPPRIDLAVVADGRLDGTLALQLAPTRFAMAGGEISIAGQAQLQHRLLQTASTRIDLRGLDLGALARLAGREPKLLGSLHGTLALARTAAGQHVDYDLGVALRDPAISIAVAGTGSDAKVDARVTATRTLDRAVLATIAAQLPLATRDGKLGLAPTGSWHVGVDLARRPLAELVALLPAPLRRAIPAGDAEVHLALAGSPAQPTGSFTVALSAMGLPDITQKVELRGDLRSDRHGAALATTGSIWLDQTHDAIALLDSTVTLPVLLANGKLDPAAIRGAATVDATLDIPDRALATLSMLEAKLAEVGGNVGGKITIHGPLALPALDASLAWHDYRTANGGAGNTTVHAHGTPASLVAEITHGGAVAITAAIDRGTDRVDIRAHAHADDTALLALIPAFVAGKLGASDPGHLRWDMSSQLALVHGTLQLGSITGSLEVAGGVVAIPHSDRRLDRIGLSLKSEAGGLRIESLAAHEHDVQVADRTISGSGMLTWTNLRPDKLHLALAAHDWLLFGSQLLGPSDAPHAAADFDLGVDVDLRAPIIAVDATVNSLALRSPDRLDRGHQPELASVSGDIIYVDRAASKTRIGRLPAAPVEAVEAPHHRQAMDVRIHIPAPIRVNQAPFDVMARGELTVAVRDEGVATRGRLSIDRGTLSLFGHDHALVDGSLSFSDEHPHGWLALTFEHRLPPAVMRDLSAASAGGGARVSFEGSPTKPKVSLSGAANAALAEVMAMDNAGRPVYVTRPNVPASSTVQAPRGDQLAMLTFMASNLPHLLFLDRISAWADPYHAAGSYGHIENVEADKYAKDQKSRVRAVARPPTPGRSSAELQYDRLLLNNDRAAFGVGLRAGSRGGGGVGMFVDWSSKD